MKKVYIYAPVDYITGHLRYGHREGIVNLTDEEFKQFKDNPKNFIYDNDVELDLLIDDWEIDDCGGIDRVEWSECKL